MPALGLSLGISFERRSSGYFLPSSDLLDGAYSVARKRVSSYSGPLIRVLNTTTTVQTNIAQLNGLLDETALMAARASGEKLVIHTVFDQSGLTRNLVSIDTTKALMIVSTAGDIQRIGRLTCGIAEADNHGCYKTANFTAFTGAQISGFWVGSFARNPGIFGTYAYGVANGTAALWGSDASAIMLYRVDQTVNGIAYRNLVPNVIPGNRSFWEDERITAFTRFTGSQSISDLGYGPGVSTSTAAFNFNNIVLGGVNNATHTMAINTKFAEMAVWRADIGSTAGRALQNDAAGAYAASSAKWNGKKIVWVGTSMPVTVTDDSNRNPYPQRLADAIGAWIVNQGTGSSRLTYSSAYNLTLTATRAEQTANGFSSSVNESYETKVLGGVGNVDYLVIDHGLNDNGQTMGAITSTTKTEYCGALNFLRTQTLSAYPACRFIALTPITNRAFGNTVPTQINTVAASMRAWAAQHSDVTVIDPLVDLAWGAAEVTAYCPDGTHLNAAGAAVVSAYLTGKFNAL